MKSLLLFFCCCCSISISAQQLSGQVQNEHGLAIIGASIKLQKVNQNEILRQIKTNEQGEFSFDIHDQDSLEVEISHQQYQTYREKFLVKELPTPWRLEMRANTQSIEEVQIKGRSPQITRKVDRLVFQVENSNISSLNAWDILKRTPMLQVQGSTISVRGSQNIVVLINDRKQIMSMDDLQSFLESTAGNEIARIEVLPNPPAKYEASGSAVINIVMKRNLTLGYKGSIYGKYEQSNYAKQLFGITQNYKTNKFNLSANYYFGRGTYARYGTDVVEYPKDQQRWESIMTRIDQNNHQESFNLNTEYAIDSSLNLNFVWSGSYQPKSKGIYQVPTNIFNPQGTQIGKYHTQNDHHRSINNQNLYFELLKKWNENHSLSWSSYFSNSNRTQFQDIQTALALPEQTETNNHFATDNSHKTRLYSSQLDINQQMVGINLEYGAKYSYVRSHSLMDFMEDANQKMIINPEKSTDFTYNEQNIAAYLSGNYAYKQWQFKAGLRSEYSFLEGLVTIPKTENKNKYLTWFPTAYIQYETKNQAQWALAYSKRINRPSYSWLNPGKSYFNQFSYFQGDPKLRATISNNLNLTYTQKNWIFDLFYSHEQWPNMEISFQNNETKELVYQYSNIKEGQAAGLSISKSLQIHKKWDIFAEVSGMYNENNFQGFDKLPYTNKVYTFNSYLKSSWTLQEKSNWKAEIIHRYFSPSIQGPFNISSFSYTDLSMSRKLLHKKLDLTLYFSDIFKSSGSKIASRYADQNNYFLDYQDTRKAGITLRYNFGNQTIKNTKSIQKTDEQQRL